MNILILTQHIVTKMMNYRGFTVKYGMFYGVVKTPFGNIPAAWSGWTSRGEIALYTLLNGVWKMRWINEEDVPNWHICFDPTIDNVDWEDTFFI